MEPSIQPLQDYNHRFVVFADDGWTGGGVLAFLLLLIGVLNSIGFSPREDLRDLFDPDVWTPVSDSLRAAFA